MSVIHLSQKEIYTLYCIQQENPTVTNFTIESDLGSGIGQNLKIKYTSHYKYIEADITDYSIW